VTASRELSSIAPRASAAASAPFGEDPPRGTGLDADDRDVVPDDVVEFAGDPQAFVDDGPSPE
jgi:hypothetical protein